MRQQPVNEHIEPPQPLLKHAAARVAFSMDAREMSDFAAALVPTGSDSYAQPGESIIQARQIRKLSAHFLTRAVLWERSRGVSWPEIAAAVGQSESWVRANWEPAEQRWLAYLTDDGEIPPPQSIDEALHLPPGDVPTKDSDIRKAAELLDDWCLRHNATSSLPIDEPAHPVTDGIVQR
jgi:hypothetical protein